MGRRVDRGGDVEYNVVEVVKSGEIASRFVLALSLPRTTAGRLSLLLGLPRELLAKKKCLLANISTLWIKRRGLQYRPSLEFVSKKEQ